MTLSCRRNHPNVPIFLGESLIYHDHNILYFIFKHKTSKHKLRYLSSSMALSFHENPFQACTQKAFDDFLRWIRLFIQKIYSFFNKEMITACKSCISSQMTLIYIPVALFKVGIHIYNIHTNTHMYINKNHLTKQYIFGLLRNVYLFSTFWEKDICIGVIVYIVNLYPHQ